MTEQKKLKILVTGAGGFLGWHMANFLTSLGHEVDGLDAHFPTKTVDGTTAKFNVVESDFRNWETTEKLLRTKDLVYHFASAHLKISLQESEYWDINVHALKKLLQLASEAGVNRFVHVSSVGAYGKLAELPASEETACHPQSIYGETKLAGENVVKEVCAETGLPFVILRPAWIYGPGCPRTGKLHRALKKRRFLMIGKGLNKRHPMYIKDMLEVFRIAGSEEKALGETFIIGGNQIITTRELIDTFSETLDVPKELVTIPYSLGIILASVIEGAFSLIGKEPPISRRTLEFFDTDNGFDVSKSQRLLHFTPKYSFREGMLDYRKTVGNFPPSA